MPENFEPRVVQMWFKNDGNNRIVNRNTRNRMSNQLADFQTFLLFVTHLMEVITKGLFPDAEVGEDVSEDFVFGDVHAGDFAEGGDGVAEVLGDEVGGPSCVQSFANSA